ncbi:MAG: hypothetical protein N3A69_18325, partial [Leptospiraceae bacterium]|nr:hypothetical protein [Leptospiraceae bacterium]
MKYGGYKKAIIYETEQTFENDLTVFNEKDYNLIEKNKYELDGIGFGVYLNNLVSVKMNKVYIITTGIYVNKDTTLNYLNLNLKGQVKIFVNNMLQNLYNEIDTGGGFKEQNYILNLRQGLNDLKIIFKGENITINKSSFNHIDVRKIDGYKDLGFNVILDNGRDDIFTLQETENKDINLSIKSGVNIETLNNYFTNNSGKIKIICYPI